jgi:hypothetical protein
MALLMVVSSVRADSTITYLLDTGNTGISGYDSDGPFGEVEVDLTSPSTAFITFTALSGGGYDFLFGDVALNVNATQYRLSRGGIDVQNRYPGFIVGEYTYTQESSTHHNQQDGFGRFSDLISIEHGYKASATTVSFLVSNIGGTWPDAASVLAPNNALYTVAAKVFVADAPANPHANAVAGSFAANGEP